ncbi:hypothetical protein BGZ94_002545 [Podila epigama]|nr:hypothetical protein BGZ94_002545 [Podila epigama]
METSQRIEKNYGCSLVFCISITEFAEADVIQSRTRTFQATSVNLSVHGHWKCDFTETKMSGKGPVDLDLSLTWVRETDLGSSRLAHEDNELVSRIASLKVRSDSTLSELLVAAVDGQFLLRGDSIHVQLRPGWVTCNGNYKYRVSFYTQRISRSRFLKNPVFPSFVDIDTSFDPERYKRDTPTDVSFRFPASSHTSEPTEIRAHSSELRLSAYLSQQVADRPQESVDGRQESCSFTCTVTAFSPAVFRVMLQYLYTQMIVLRKPPHISEPLYACHAEADQVQQGTCLFEDLFKISDQYEILPLKELAIQAVHNTLNMNIAISLLTKEPTAAVNIYTNEAAPVYVQTSKQIAMNIVKEYIYFFGTGPFSSQPNNMSTADMPVHERRNLISDMGEHILGNLSRLWTL